jgi:hypothetical protein
METFRIPLGSIQGSKWNDINANGIWDEGEKALAGWTIYIDSVTNGKLDTLGNLHCD